MKHNLWGTLTKHMGQIRRNRIPAQVVIQITSRCNATCPQCGMRRTADINRYVLSDDTVRKILDGCAANGVTAVSFTGGEPLLLLDRLIGWMRYAGRVGITYIRTGTNGFMFRGSHRAGFADRMKRFADRLADTPLRNFWISIDSYDPAVHEEMRGLPGVIEGIAKALPIFHAAGIYPSANLGINRNVGGMVTRELAADRFRTRRDYLNEFYDRYKTALNQFYHYIKGLGFSAVNTCYPMSISDCEKKDGLNAVYAATTIEDIVRFSADEKAMLYQALLDTIPLHRGRLRIFSPLSSLYTLQHSYDTGEAAKIGFGCRGGVDFFFIDAKDGDTYPCGYRGNENLGKFWRLRVDKIRPNGDCHRCDWECFRDPSELCAPFLQGAQSPIGLIRALTGKPAYARLWFEDLRYYHACHLFDGRRPLESARLKRFRKNEPAI